MEFVWEAVIEFDEIEIKKSNIGCPVDYTWTIYSSSFFGVYFFSVLQHKKLARS